MSKPSTRRALRAEPRRRRAHLSYRDAGVDIHAMTSAIAGFGAAARGTFTPAVLTDIGAFGSLYDLSRTRVKKPVLVSSIDGVGTKLKIAFLTGRHGSVGEDLVNHCVNDILVQGAVPLFFLDYLATGRVDKRVLLSVVRGMAVACRRNGCALIGGETAEMPGFYRDGEYDLAGCIVGLVERRAILDGARIRPGDILVGLASSGLHTNGYSLARKVLLENMRLRLSARLSSLPGTLGDELLRPHRSYLNLIRPMLSTGDLKGIAHITGGGLTDNIPRILPRGCGVEIDPHTWEPPPIFRLIQEGGSVRDSEMRRTFNLGVGLVVVASPAAVVRIRRRLEREGETSVIIGRVIRGARRVFYRRIRW